MPKKYTREDENDFQQIISSLEKLFGQEITQEELATKISLPQQFESRGSVAVPPKPGEVGEGNFRTIQTTLYDLFSGKVDIKTEMSPEDYFIDDFDREQLGIAGSIEDLDKIREMFGLKQASELEKTASPPAPIPPQMQQTAPKGPQPEASFPRFSIGEVVYDPATMRKGIVVDMSWQTKRYVVKWDDSAALDLVDGENLAKKEEVFRYVTDKPKIPLESVGKEQPVEKPKSQEISEVIKEVLADPRVAPIVVEKLLEANKIPVDDLSLILKGAGKATPFILQHLLDRGRIDKVLASKLFKEYLKSEVGNG